MIELIFDNPIEVKKFGDFAVQKSYHVPNSKGGKIIQIIKRRSQLTDVNKITYSTTKNISEYTSGNVEFSNFDYVEVFQMVKGYSQGGGDLIKNGALTKYDKDNYAIIYDSIKDKERLPYLTTGKIDVTGINYYVNTDKYKEFVSIYNPIKKLDSPANGLPMFPLNNEKEFQNVVDWLNKNSEYGPINHNIKVIWNNNKTILYNYIGNELQHKIEENHYVDYIDIKFPKQLSPKSSSLSPSSPKRSPSSPKRSPSSPKSSSLSPSSPKSSSLSPSSPKRSPSSPKRSPSSPKSSSLSPSSPKRSQSK
jgi:hypothetical protein